MKVPSRPAVTSQCVAHAEATICPPITLQIKAHDGERDGDIGAGCLLQKLPGIL